MHPRATPTWSGSYARRRARSCAHHDRRPTVAPHGYTRVNPAGMLRDGSIMPVALRQARRTELALLCAFSLCLCLSLDRAVPCRAVPCRADSNAAAV